MKVIIAGSRNVHISNLILEEIVNASGYSISEVVSGTCRGVDKCGESWAAMKEIRVKRFYPDWSIGKKAGPIRNKEMAQYADALIAIWNGESRGTKNMIAEMEALGKPVYIWRTDVQTNK